MRLGKTTGASARGACVRALALGASSYRSLESILRQGLEREPLPARTDSSAPAVHANVRGRDYYQ